MSVLKMMMRKQIAFALIVMLGLSLIPVSFQGLSFNETSAQERREKPKTRRSQVLGKSAFQKIERAQELLAERNHAEALSVLNDIIEGKNFKPFEKAVARQRMGFVFADQGDYQKTIDIFEKAIASGDLDALALLDEWFTRVGDKPAPDAFAFKAQIHLSLDDYSSAEQSIRAALSKVQEPKKQWVRILLAVLLQDERYKEARPHLEDAVQRWPGEKSFWQQLSAVYFDAGDEDLAFVTQQAMYIQGMLTTSKELKRMAQLYLYHDVPIKAAQILDEGIRSDKIEASAENYELLANAYMHAREWEKSIKPLTIAAKQSKEGKLYAQLGQSYLQDEKWKEAESALELALKKGGLKDEGQTWLLLGITRTKIDEWEPAIKAFSKAGDFDDVAKDAFRWIRSIERPLAEMARLEKEANKP
jgi:tetratricopeptide (TPR) repeat protein